MKNNDIENMSPEEIKKNMNQGCVIGVVALILVVIFTVYMCSDNNEDERISIAETELNTKDEHILGSEEWKLEQISNLKSDSTYLREANYLDKAKESNFAMSKAIDYLNTQVIRGGIASQKEFYENDKRASVPLKYIRKRAKAILNNVMPIYRKSFAKNMADAAWENDIYVTSSGSNHTILNITGATFAANKNISDFQNTINKDVYHFGFKEVRYRWYKGADSYTSYKF